MTDDIKFETLVDVHSNIFQEYISSVIVKLQGSNSEYHTLKEKISGICERHPAVLSAVDVEKPGNLTEQECKALIEVMGLRWVVTGKMSLQSFS